MYSYVIGRQRSISITCLQCFFENKKVPVACSLLALRLRAFDFHKVCLQHEKGAGTSYRRVYRHKIALSRHTFCTLLLLQDWWAHWDASKDLQVEENKDDIHCANYGRPAYSTCGHYIFALWFLLLVHGQVTIIFVVSVCLSVCLFVCLFVCAEFFSVVFDPISIKLGHSLCYYGRPM